ncbi:FlgD immunoglobulin-like domain containing protein [Candidatus Eisenbacteria bacterium]|uniref:FlgD immunoglobulin-like domain containing protein n=1 Tax=Eiseniibacteriota bacterium TaxID=2212470 RepID=A0ABV6YQ24_UNCEI
MSKCLCVTKFWICLVCLLLSSASAEPLNHSYVEDFTTLQYCDTVNTTAWWDTLAGEVKPHLFQIELAGSCDTPGDARGIAISGDYVYVADLTSGLQLIDVSDPEDPAIVGSYDTPGNAYGVAISGDRAYVADDAFGLQVISIGNPTNPLLSGTCDTPGSAFGVAISGDYAYVADYISGLQVIDISDPTNPTLAGSYATGKNTFGVAISGDYAYVADSGSGLQVIDISDPTSPTLAGSCGTLTSASSVAISGDYAYVADNGSGLQVIDISDPTNPVVAGTYSGSSLASCVAISGDYAYVADRTSGLQVVDISDPENPVSAGSYDTPGSAQGVVLSGEYAYVADFDAGLQVIDVTDRTPPSLAGSCDLSGNVYNVAISGDYAYVANYWLGLQVVDIGDPINPVYAGGYSTPDNAYNVAISGDYAYIAESGSGLYVIDISDPTTPASAGSCDTPGHAYDVAISGDNAYVADAYQGLQVIDISDPTNPTIVGYCDTQGDAEGVAIAGDYAYIVDRANYDGFQVISIIDPTNPTLVGSCHLLSEANSVVVSGGYAYVTGTYGMEIVNIGVPVAPVRVAGYNTGDDALGVAIWGDRAYVAVRDSGLHVVDIHIPWMPVFAGSYDTPQFARGVAISGDHAYVADGSSGLQVIGVFQRVIDNASNSAWSLSIDETDDAIVSARLSSTQTDSIRWEITNNSWSSWMELAPDDQIKSFPVPGNDLRWRTVHVHRAAYPDVIPTCTGLSIEWFYNFAPIDSIVDVPGDQGGWVRIYFTRSGFDILDEPGYPNYPVAMYGVYRRIDDMAFASRIVAEGEAMNPEGPPLSDLTAGGLDDCRYRGPADATVFQWEDKYFLISDGMLSSGPPPGTWEVLGSVPAHQQDQYIFLASTLADSSETLMYSAYCVSAETTSPSVYFFSYPDSGYSIDNLAPSPPSGLMMPTAIDLAWNECADDDFNYFTVYGSAVPDLDYTASIIGYTIETVLDLSGNVYDYYHVTATDFAGNEGNASSLQNETAGIPDVEDRPTVFALKQNEPNPFESNTVIGFDVPKTAALSIKVYDSEGRLVKILARGEAEPGRHRITWVGDDDHGHPASPGIYFIKMETPGFTARGKAVLLR